MSTVYHEPKDGQVKVALAGVMENVSETILAGLLSTLEPTTMPSPDELREAMEAGVAKGLVAALESMSEAYAVDVVGAKRYERSTSRKTRRSGARSRRIVILGKTLRVRFPKLRQGRSAPELVRLLAKPGSKVSDLLKRMWLRGLSLRDIAEESEALAGQNMSHERVRWELNELRGQAEAWRNRPIDRPYRYLMLDAFYVSITRGDEASKEAVLLALGITEDGHKEVLEVFVAPTESKESWGTVLSRLKLRGLDVKALRLVLSDGHAGLIQAIDDHLPKVTRQRCVLHKIRNVMGRSPRAIKKETGRAVSHIFKAPSRSEAEARTQAFVDKYKAKYPKVVQPLETDIEAMFAFYDFPPRLWKSLRTTNALERVNREFRRKLREVGSLHGGEAALSTAVAVATFLNQQWEGRPIKGFQKKKT